MKQLLIRKIRSFEECEAFIRRIQRDATFSDPMLSNEEQVKNNLLKAIKKPESHCVLGVFRDGDMVGLFSFLALEEEQYLEMLVGLSYDQDAYDAVFAYLQRHYPSYDADFVFNPKNDLLKDILKGRHANFETEQQKMVPAEPAANIDTTGIELLSDEYKPQYFAMHNTDMYWTGEKVAAAADKFRTLLAIENGIVAGYIDVTHCFEENEPYDLLVKEEYRRKGYGRKLLAKAIEMNKPNGMMLLVNVDNVPAICLYESLGFQKAEDQNSLTVHWKIGTQTVLEKENNNE